MTAHDGIVRPAVQWVVEQVRRDPNRAAARLMALIVLLAMPVWVVSPWLDDWSTFGFHDWDVQTAHRHLVVSSLLEHGQFPGWNPYACGGFPAWGYVEADTILVSPWLPLYLLLEMSVALRLEVLGYAILGTVGAYVLGRRFTTSIGAALLVAVLWGVNGRWGLQTASGHTWHLAYAYLPWCWAFYERARMPEARVWDFAKVGACLAMLVYAGGIYPLPHTVLLLGTYGAALAIAERSLRPLTALAISGAVGVGLSAPKLLPLLATFGRAPRLIESTEHFPLGALWTALTSHDQAFYSRPAQVTPYGWHEWGIYISVVGALGLAFAVVLVRGRRENVLKIVGLFFVVLGLGAFHASAPWPWMHEHLPVFRSQHVPSRFMHPAVLVLALVLAAGLGRWVHKRRVQKPWLDLLLVCLCAGLAYDIGSVARKPMADAMWMVPPTSFQPAERFHYREESPLHYVKRDWAGPMYLAMLGNTGVIRCYGTPPFGDKGAISVDDVRYRGEAVLPEGGTATVQKWSPNEVVVDVDASSAGPLVYNMNWDQGWTAAVSTAAGERSGAAIAVENALATEVPAGASEVTFTYRAPGTRVGLLLALATAILLGAARHRERRRCG